MKKNRFHCISEKGRLIYNVSLSNLYHIHSCIYILPYMNYVIENNVTR